MRLFNASFRQRIGSFPWPNHWSLAVAFVVICLSCASPARADILVSPLRHVLTLGTEKAVFTISNPSDRIVDVRVHWIDLTATETGYRDARPEERAMISAAPYLAVSPAFHRLKPGAREQVTVTLRPDRRPPRGERRSHLLFETAAHRTNLRKVSGLEADIGLSVSAPVILRRGKPQGDASFSSTRLLRDENGDLTLETKLRRKGAHSTFGRLEIALQVEGEETTYKDDHAGDRGNGEIIATLRNASLFTDVSERAFVLPIGRASLPKSILTVRYIGDGEYAGTVFAQKRFSIAAPAPPPPLDR